MEGPLTKENEELRKENKELREKIDSQQDEIRRLLQNCGKGKKNDRQQ